MPGSLVSVIIPTYNRAYCVGRAIDSALGQTHTDMEVVVVDDGSTDDTRDMIKSRYGAEPRVVYHHQANKGIAGARNAGLARASGDYIALLDSDDEWRDWKIELQLACMRAHPEVGMTWTDMVAIDPDGKVLSPSFLRQMYSAYGWFPTSESLFSGAHALDAISPLAKQVAPGRKFFHGDIGWQILMGNLVHTSTVLLTRERALAVKEFREDLRHAGEDYEFHLRTCRLGPVGYLDVPSIEYRRGRSDQATVSSNSIHMAQNFLKVIEPVLLDESEGRKPPRKMKRAVLAEAHAWIGEQQLQRNNGQEARRSFSRSLRYRPLQARSASLLLASCLPSPWMDPARRILRAVRGLGGRKAL
jgi:glycosyltransferase involved in cell wall biosynthesis